MQPETHELVYTLRFHVPADLAEALALRKTPAQDAGRLLLLALNALANNTAGVIAALVELWTLLPEAPTTEVSITAPESVWEALMDLKFARAQSQIDLAAVVPALLWALVFRRVRHDSPIANC